MNLNRKVAELLYRVDSAAFLFLYKLESKKKFYILITFSRREHGMIFSECRSYSKGEKDEE